MTPSRVQLAPRRPILWVWAILTTVFVVCAYLIALVIALVCALFSLALLRSVNFISLFLALGIGTCAAAILWSMLPQRDKFVPPGPAIDPSSQPRLFAEIARIAAAFNEPMPSAVYITLQANAWVARRGGILGFGSRRVMALGLPLLSILTVSELRAVVAPEFAHYYGGDTGLGPWIGRARQSLARSLQRLTTEWAFLNFISRWAIIGIIRLVIVLIFSAYWKVFLRLTLLVSRQWEYRADELACAVAGAQPLINGIRKVEGAALVWPSFWQSEAAPALQAGFEPPLADGFSRYLVAPAITQKLPALVAPILDKEKPAATDTHPTFRQREQRALSYKLGDVPQIDAAALTLLAETASLERSAVQVALPSAKVDQFRPLAWDQVGDYIWIPRWVAFVVTQRENLAAYTVADLPALVADVVNIGGRIKDPKGRLLTREQRLERGAELLWIALALALMSDGWRVRSQPGDSYLIRGDRKLVPHDVVAKLRTGAMTAAEYLQLVTEIGAAELRLVPPAKPK